MIGLLCFVLASAFKSKLRLEAENAVLRHHLIVLRRRPHGHVRLTRVALQVAGMKLALDLLKQVRFDNRWRRFRVEMRGVSSPHAKLIGD